MSTTPEIPTISDGTNYQAYHKAMVGELFIFFLLYLVFMFKFPKKYGKSMFLLALEITTDFQNLESVDEPAASGNQNSGQMDNRAPADPVNIFYDYSLLNLDGKR